MRTGQEYRESIRDGRRVYICGERIEDVTTHPLTASMVDASAEWYDAHFDPALQDVLTTIDNNGQRQPISFRIPKTPDQLHRLGESIRLMAFKSAGNITHPPSYGNLITLGALDPILSYGRPDWVPVIQAFYDRLTREGRMLCAPYISPVGDRFHPQGDRLTPRVVKETDAGIVVRGAVGLGTGICYAEFLLTAPLPNPNLLPEQALWFVFPVNAPGAWIMTRTPAARREDSFLYPLSTRFDELDAMVYLEDVFIPWEHVFVYRDPDFCNQYLDRHVRWLTYHHLVRMLARAEYSFGLALAVADALGTKGNPAVIETLTDLLIHTETLRTAVRASEADAEITPAGSAMPNYLHLGTGTIYCLKNRPWMADTVRTLAGYGGMLAPSLADIKSKEIGDGVTAAYAGGGYSALQRAALYHLIRDHTASALDGREAAFEALASAGVYTWRLRLRQTFDRYSELANDAIAILGDMPKIDIDLSGVKPLERSDKEAERAKEGS